MPRIFTLIFLIFLCIPSWVSAQSIVLDKEDQGEFKPRAFVVPYAFRTDLLDLAAGVGFGGRGYYQPQAAFAGTALGSSNGSFALYLFAQDVRLSSSRFFIDPRISIGTFDELESFRDGNPDFPDERAGSNDSDEDNFVKSEGEDIWLRFNFKYVLPIGHAADDPVATYVLDRGVLEEGSTGGDFWNPLRSGRTYLETKPFYRKQDLSSDFGDDAITTSGLEFTLRHENVDFISDPSKGSIQRFTVVRDWGALGSDSTWTVLEGELTKFFSLGESDNFRRRVLALNFWTSDNPTRETATSPSGEEDFTHKPPFYAGANLGGVDRLRAYPTSRFNDKSAIYYSAELRLMPHWHPLGDVSWLKFLKIDWWQWVLFGEVGRVADTYNLDELHTKMKADVGFGFRAMVKHLVVRTDFAFGDEGAQVQMMVAHPFPER